MKRLEMGIADCRDCPYCRYQMTKSYRCKKTGTTLREADGVITPPDDCPLPDCEPSGNTG